MISHISLFVRVLNNKNNLYTFKAYDNELLVGSLNFIQIIQKLKGQYCSRKLHKSNIGVRGNL